MDAIQIVRLALSIIGERLLTVLALLLVFAMGCWSMYEPQWERLVALTVFAIFTFLVLRRDRSMKDEKVSGE